MVKIETLPLGSYQTNCYIVYPPQGKHCVLIDPGYRPDVILDRLQTLDLTPVAIFLTHGHFDHVGAVEELVERTGCELWMREADWSIPNNPMMNQLFPLANQDFCQIHFYGQGETLTRAGLRFVVHETPGHTWGSVCLECENALFTGDTLFAGSCGRIDLPGGDMPAMRSSLIYLSRLEPNFDIYPGHGESSSLDEEKGYNPYLKGLL